jgi:hypothetical protein
MYKILTCFLPAFLFSVGLLAATPHIDPERTKQIAKQALTFCHLHGYNTTYCILIDMSLPSGVKRLMLWDFRKNQVVVSGLVSHGCGSGPWAGVWSKDRPSFSNLDHSHCTSLGKYRVDGRAWSMWGIHVKYFLAGLENSNNNARVRQVVFHSWEQVPENEVYPGGTPEGWGCPAVANHLMKRVDPLLRKQQKHVLLWIYD